MSHMDPIASPSLDARCAFHPETTATAACQRCGTFVCHHCLQWARDGRRYCGACAARALPPQASREDRFLANLVDSFVVFVPFIVGLVAMAITDELTGQEVLSIPLLLGGILGSLLLCGWQIYYAATNGQSLGKRWRHIRVVRMDGSHVSIARILLLRNLLPGILNQVLCVFGLADAICIFREDRRCIHDYLADTQVIQVPEHERTGTPSYRG
ncbi:RDD family protein [Myxococcus llanfairpwllgwyngyllgogerychwyrndrobwllllantysiliogogogochensis]|uniref:RDD family protein n=1 Tax=Myxococcus llanfairpwllgwyngyllgogerychwyrndrobwllllantysiliogogogochensis TaxID=2590453 RepID=A0A540WSD1_9BACT|nr:RDD family protein [Myxococcus llanfairpwllgwyngyllgogerychwyrndrobwllllantysiliogogogochensis]TQF11936.1 RDD family protein [Myxococcus llanfairpwllgwyngyllgogerychwyrndrobwllllantysiliogogogochensis]